MNPVSRRIARVVAVLATLVLAACAVPGQGDPGVAATYGDRVVTNQQVLDYDQAFADLGTPATGPGVALTLLLLGPEVIAAAEDRGFTVTDDEAMIAAKAWMRYADRDGTPTSDALDVVRAELALIELLTTDAGFAALEEITRGIEDDAVISPRHGAFTQGAVRGYAHRRAQPGRQREAGDRPRALRRLLPGRRVRRRAPVVDLGWMTRSRASSG